MDDINDVATTAVSGTSRRRLLAGGGAAALALGLAACSGTSKSASSTSTSGAAAGADAGSQVFYWVSHGAPNDQIHVIANKGATQAGKDFGVSVRTSFHNNNVASQQQAIQSAIAAKAAGIATSIPQPKVFDTILKGAIEAGIPVITFNQDDLTTGRAAYVGADLTKAGAVWANYLVDNKLVKAGDNVWLPVEVAGASYQVLETTGIKSVFDPLGITVDVFQAGGDPATSLTAMTNYVTAHKSTIQAVIGLGDQVMSNISGAFKAVNVPAGKIPVVGWGNAKATAESIKAGYVQAALWQYPDSQGYQPIALLKMITGGLATGYDITTQALYTKDTVANFERFMS